jgi:hypothetical protein
MIPANELKLGNLIFWNPKLSNPGTTLSSVQVEVAVISEDKIGYTPYILEHRVEPFEDDRMVQMETLYKPLAELEPITLKRELLFNCGFEEKGQGRFVLNSVCLEEQDDSVFILASKDDNNHHPARYKYLHQIQNLYLALEGKELEINP